MSERDKVLDQHVVYYLKNHPEFYDKHNLVRVRESVYKIDGREISVDWHHPDNDGEQGHLLVIDGNLRQPFADYVQGTGLNIEKVDKRGRKVNAAKCQQPAEAPTPVPVQAGQTHGTPMYCPNHDASEKRKKTKARELACKSCGETIQTNYAEFCLCPTCSHGQQRCMCCGSNASPSAHGPSIQDPMRHLQGLNSALKDPLSATTMNFNSALKDPLGATTMNFGGLLEASQDKAPAKHGQPVYCARHNQSDRRKKTKPRDMECTHCGKSIQTNYVDFCLCPGCSQEQQRCMCCGDRASASAPAAARSSSQNIYPPRQSRMSTTSQPPPSTTTRPSGVAGLLSSAWPTGLFSSPPPQTVSSQDRYNAYASQKPMSAQHPNRGLSFVSVAPPYNPMATYNVVNPMASQMRF